MFEITLYDKNTNRVAEWETVSPPTEERLLSLLSGHPCVFYDKDGDVWAFDGAIIGFAIVVEKP